jgi:hypothetical protein
MEIQINFGNDTFKRIAYGFLLLLAIAAALTLFVLGIAIDVWGVPAIVWFMIVAFVGFLLFFIVWEGGGAILDWRKKKKEDKKEGQHGFLGYPS